MKNRSLDHDHDLNRFYDLNRGLIQNAVLNHIDVLNYKTCLKSKIPGVSQVHDADLRRKRSA